MLDAIIHSYYPDCYDRDTYFKDRLMNFMFKSDSDRFRFYNFNVYLFKEVKSEITEWDHGPCWNPVEYWEDIHGYEKTHDINCGRFRNYSQIGFGFNMWIYERILFFIIFILCMIFISFTCLIHTLIFIYGIFTILRLRQLVIYIKFKKKYRFNKTKDIDVINVTQIE